MWSSKGNIDPQGHVNLHPQFHRILTTCSIFGHSNPTSHWQWTPWAENIRPQNLQIHIIYKIQRSRRFWQASSRFGLSLFFLSLLCWSSTASFLLLLIYLCTCGNPVQSQWTEVWSLPLPFHSLTHKILFVRFKSASIIIEKVLSQLLEAIESWKKLPQLVNINKASQLLFHYRSIGRMVA